MLKVHSNEKIHMFLFDSVEKNYIKNIFNTLHHTMIYDERDILMNKMLIFAIEFIKVKSMTSLFLL